MRLGVEAAKAELFSKPVRSRLKGLPHRKPLGSRVPPVETSNAVAYCDGEESQGNAVALLRL